LASIAQGGNPGQKQCLSAAVDIITKCCYPCPQTYNVTNLLEDIKGLYKIAGFKGHPVCFLFTDAEVKDEAFLEYINQLLMTGEVAGGAVCCCIKRALLGGSHVCYHSMGDVVCAVRQK
jgi:hypothetical protein